MAKKIEICTTKGGGQLNQLMIDGEEFPYYITAEGPVVKYLGHSDYTVTVEIFCDEVQFNLLERDVK